VRVPTDLSEKQLLSVKIEESGEKLVDVRQECPEILIHPLLGKTDTKPLVRKTIARMLNSANSFLPDGIVLMLRDAYRSADTQRRIYSSFIKKFKKENPLWSEARLKEETNKFAADPKGLIPGGHTTGAAVDVTLAYAKNKKRLAMKTTKLNYQEQTRLDSMVPRHIRKNRKLLYDATIKAGFVNYPNEWWHYSYGDVFATARQGGKIAIYGAVEQ